MLRILLLHFVIAALYTVYVYLLYTYGTGQDTLSAGILYAALTLAHLLITIIVCLVILIVRKNKKGWTMWLLEHIVSVFAGAVVAALGEQFITAFAREVGRY